MFRTSLVLLLGLSFAAVLPTAALAKKKRHVVYDFQYVVPFTCGSNAADTSSALPGDYAIAIDLLNAGADTTVSEQVQVTFPPGGQVAGSASDIVDQALAASTSIQLGCDDLLGAGFVFQTPPPASTWYQGLLILTSRTQLQVFATRTAQGPAGDLSTQTERVVGRPVRAALRGPAKVAVCHAPPGNPANAHTIHVDASSWPAHRGHGDIQGVCPGR